MTVNRSNRKRGVRGRIYPSNSLLLRWEDKKKRIKGGEIKTIRRMLELNKIYCMDNMKGMAEFPDKYFELAIIDPEYGIGINNMSYVKSGSIKSGKAIRTDFSKMNTDWDNKTPDGNYFQELKRVSKNQIIWGWNYFVPYLESTPCYIVWDKDRNNDFADCETAWTSFNDPARVFKFTWDGMRQGDMKNKESRIHPTQKPVALYKWLLKNYAKPGDKILDTHGGSFSSVIACLEMGFEYIAFEIDEEYYNNGLKRIQEWKNKPQIFQPKLIPVQQSKLF